MVSSHVTKSIKRRYISQVSNSTTLLNSYAIDCFLTCNCSRFFENYLQTPERTLDAPDLVDDYYLNLLDWGSSNVLSIALGNTVYLWNASDGSASEFVTIDEDTGPVTSDSWAPDGQHIADGLNTFSCGARAIIT